MLPSQDYGGDTDWWDEITRAASYNLNQYLSIDSSTKNGFFGVSLNYKQGNGLDIVSGRKEYGARFVGEQRVLNNRLQFNASLSGRRVHEDWGNDGLEDWGNDGLFDTALTMNPTIPVKNPDGTYYQPNSPTDIHNPVNDLRENINEGDRVYLLGNTDVKLNILQTERHMLNTSLSYALQYNDQKSNFYTPSTSSESFWNGYDGRARVNYQKWWTNRLEWLTNYALNLDEHQIKLVLGYSWERSNWEQSGNENKDFVYDSMGWYGIGNGTALQDGKASLWAGASESTLIGFFGRLNYNYNDMLFLSASMRREGSTKFGANTKWGNFPSASVAWEITRKREQDLPEPQAPYLLRCDGTFGLRCLPFACHLQQLWCLLCGRRVDQRLCSFAQCQPRPGLGEIDRLQRRCRLCGTPQPSA